MTYYLVLPKIHKAALYILLYNQEISVAVIAYCGVLSKIVSTLLTLDLSDFFSIFNFLQIIIENNGNQRSLKENIAKFQQVNYSKFQIFAINTKRCFTNCVQRLF